MAREELVVDASVAIKWFTGEENTDLALKLRDAYFRDEVSLIAPDLILYEILNALRYKKGVASDSLREWIRDIIDMQMDFFTPNSEILEKAVESSTRWDVTLYDACYLALAELTGTKMLTADEKLYKKVKESGRVIMLHEIYERTSRGDQF